MKPNKPKQQSGAPMKSTNFFSAQQGINQMGDMYGMLANIDNNPPQQQVSQSQQKQQTQQQPQKQQQIKVQPKSSNQQYQQPRSSNQQQQQPKSSNQSQQQKQQQSQEQVGVIQAQEQEKVKFELKPSQQQLKVESVQVCPQILQKYQGEYGEMAKKSKIYDWAWNKIKYHVVNDNQLLPILNFNQNSRQVFEAARLKIEQIRKSSEVFVDSMFKIKDDNKSLEITRMDDIQKDVYQIYTREKIYPEAVIQGELGNCYFVSSLSVLSENPDNIIRLFGESVQERGYYQVWIAESGSFKNVVVDDSFLTRNQKLIFARGIQNDIWVPLLEKAYSKLYGGYNWVQVGQSSDALRDLTGAPTEYFELENIEQSFKTIRESLQKGYYMTASSKTESETIISFHCYSILDALEKGGRRFLKIRNPHGTNFKAGELTPEEQNIVGGSKYQPGGILWMSLQEFQENFELVTCCKIHPNYFYCFLQTKTDERQFHVTVFQKTHLYLSLHQIHDKFFKKQLKNDPYKYKLIRLIVAKIENGGLKTLTGNFCATQTCTVELELEAGEYLVQAEVDGYKEYAISAYCSSPVSLANFKEVYQLDETKIVPFLIQNYLTKNPQIYSEIREFSPNLVRRFGPLFGFVYIFYQNNSNDTLLTETIEQYPVLENLTPYIPNQLNNIKVELKPGQQSLLLLKIGNLNNGSHKLRMQTKFNLVKQQSDQELTEEAIQKGTLKPKTPDSKIKVFSLKYSKGFFLLYRNDSDKDFTELLIFKTLQNLSILSEKGETSKELKISLKPNQTYWIKLSFIELSNTASSYSVSSQIVAY